MSHDSCDETSTSNSDESVDVESLDDIKKRVTLLEKENAEKQQELVKLTQQITHFFTDPNSIKALFAAIESKNHSK